jgi:hypothetical protein
VLSAVGRGEASVDQVTASSGLPGQQVLSTLTVLEMRRRVSGFAYVRL